VRRAITDHERLEDGSECEHVAIKELAVMLSNLTATGLVIGNGGARRNRTDDLFNAINMVLAEV
jgi:hypothetical protein